MRNFFCNSLLSFFQSNKDNINKSIMRFIRRTGVTENPPFTRLCRASSLPIAKDFHGIQYLDDYVSLPLEKPLFYLDEVDQLSYLKWYQLASKETTYQGGIISASNIYVSLPSSLHRWRDKVFIEAIMEDKRYVSFPTCIIAIETMPFVSNKKMPESILLSLPSHNNYYHWMIEILPRLKMIESDESLKNLLLIMPKTKSPKFIQESLRIVGILERTIFLEDGVYQFEKLHIPTLLSPSGNPSPKAVDWLRKKFLNKNIVKGTRRTYISRRDATSRSVSNESEVEKILAEFGFETVCMTNYSLEEQIKIFQESEIVIGSHGAAFANLIFMPSNSVFIEFFKEGHFYHGYYHIANIRELKYGFLVCKNDGEGLYVDINKLSRLLEQSLGTQSKP